MAGSNILLTTINMLRAYYNDGGKHSKKAQTGIPLSRSPADEVIQLLKALSEV